MSIPLLALAAYLVFVALAFGLRSWLQYRRTGHTGFVGIRGRVGSLEWLGGVLFAVTVAAAGAAPLLQWLGWLEPWPALETPVARLAGLAFFALGLSGTMWSQWAMGRSWRIGVDHGERTDLILHGPFRLVRNPIYTAILLAAVGLVLAVPNWLSFATLATLLLALQMHVRNVEEPYLRRVHGDDYLRYAQSTGRFLPGIGRM